jgi:hypothetical protein
MQTIKRILLIAGALLLAFLAYGFYVANTPDGEARIKERRTIEACWEQQGRKSLTPQAARFVAGACEKLEADYRAKWNRDP